MPTKLVKDRRRIPQGERIVNQIFTLPVVTACQAVTYKRIGITKKQAGKCRTYPPEKLCVPALTTDAV
jgi:hypothetical protein